MDSNGDLRFSIMSEDDAEAICAMSKRIADKHNPNIKYVIYKKRVPAPFESLSMSSRSVILVSFCFTLPFGAMFDWDNEKICISWITIIRFWISDP